MINGRSKDKRTNKNKTSEFIQKKYVISYNGFYLLYEFLKVQTVLRQFCQDWIVTLDQNLDPRSRITEILYRILNFPSINLI